MLYLFSPHKELSISTGMSFLPRMCHLHLHLLLWGSISVTDDCDDTTEFHPKIGSVLRATLLPQTPTYLLASHST